MNTRPGIIPRKNLMNIFDGLSGERFVYVSAPAGYGKTISIKQWLEFSDCKNAVISIDEYDNKPVNLCARFCAALSKCQPKNKALAEIISHPAFKTAPDEFAFHAILTLDDSEKAILVIDDLHFITAESTHRLLSALLKRLPEKMQVFILSRHKVPECFLELWVKNSISCVTAEQLRFNVKEIMSLYEKRGHIITPRHAKEILHYTDGWAIGIGAVLLSGSGTDEFLVGRLEYLDKYLEENVWQRWDEETHEFMLKTSVVQDMTPELCNIMTGNGNSREILDRLVLENMFITRSGDGIYTYHNLFRNFLESKLNQKETEYYNDLLQKAGRWYLSQRDFQKSIDCFIKCECYEGIAECSVLFVTSEREYFLVEKLLKVADSSVILSAAERFPFIYSLLMWGAYIEGNAENMARYADLYYANQSRVVEFDPGVALNIVLIGLIDFRKSLFELIRFISGIIKEPSAEKLGRQGVSHGTVNQNMPFLHRGTRDFSECAVGDVEKNIGLMSAAFGTAFGERAVLLKECLLSGLWYEQGHLEKAHRHAANAAAKINADTTSEVKFFTLSMLARILYATEQNEEAEKIIKRIAAMIEEENAYFLNYNFNAFKTRRELENGDMRAAREWLKNHEPPIDGSLDFYSLYIHITTCRAYITNGNYDSAIVLLKKALELSEKYKRPLDVIEINILLAIAHWRKKRSFQKEALFYLENAVTEAHNYSFIQIFITEGAEIKGMLERLYMRLRQSENKSLIPTGFIKHLSIKALECPTNGLTSEHLIKSDIFTEKQQNIMRLLYEGKTINGIGAELGISRTTVRSHLSSIYGKLGVTNQIDAINSAKKLGIFVDE